MHLFIGLRPHQSLSDLMRMVKGESSEWINKEALNSNIFRWQEGFGAFSYSRSQVKLVTDYILSQEEHHRKKSFLEEYKSFLDHFDVEYDERYVFRSLE